MAKIMNIFLGKNQTHTNVEKYHYMHDFWIMNWSSKWYSYPSLINEMNSTNNQKMFLITLILPVWRYNVAQFLPIHNSVVPILVEIGSVVLNQKLSLYFHHLSSIPPSEKGQSPSFEKLP